MSGFRHRDVVAAMLAVWGGVTVLGLPALVGSGGAATPLVAVMAGLGAGAGGFAARRTIDRLTPGLAGLAGALAGLLLTAIVARRHSLDLLAGTATLGLAATAWAGAAAARPRRAPTPTTLAGLIAVATAGTLLGLAELILGSRLAPDPRLTLILIAPITAGAMPRLLVPALGVRHTLAGMWLMTLLTCALIGLFAGSLLFGAGFGLVAATGATHFGSVGAVLIGWPREPRARRPELPAARTRR